METSVPGRNILLAARGEGLRAAGLGRSAALNPHLDWHLASAWAKGWHEAVRAGEGRVLFAPEVDVQWRLALAEADLAAGPEAGDAP